MSVVPLTPYVPLCLTDFNRLLLDSSCPHLVPEQQSQDSSQQLKDQTDSQSVHKLCGETQQKERQLYTIQL